MGARATALAVLLLLVLLIIFTSVGSTPPRILQSPAASPTSPLLVLVAGQHGNEPAPSLAVERFLGEARGRPVEVLAVPRANPWGLRWGVRETGPWGDADLNRTCSLTTPDPDGANADPAGRDLLRSLLRTAAAARARGRPVLVIDFHEGWGFHRRWLGVGPRSLGSTLSPSPAPLAQAVAQAAALDLNAGIPDPSRHFTVMPSTSNCEIPSTLVCAAERLGLPALLVETTGQGDVQPLDLRVAQSLAVCRAASSLLTSLRSKAH
jgi:predicted deacylase